MRGTDKLVMKSQPGFPHKDISWLAGLIAVRAPLAHIKALATTKSRKKTQESGAFQLKSSDFSLLFWKKCEPELSKWLSNKLKTTVVYLWFEDTSDWVGYSIFEDGAEVEVFQFGPNYQEELAEFAEEMGNFAPKLKERQKGWDVFVTEDGEDFQFRSKLVKIAKPDLLSSRAKSHTGLTFVDTRFKALGVPIPRDFPEAQQVISWPTTP
jgi:hypothetical protein